MPTFKSSNKRHETEMEVEVDHEGFVCVTLDMSHRGLHEMGLAFWLTTDQERELFDWLKQRRDGR